MFLWVAHLRGTPKRYFHASVSVGHRLFSFGGFCRERTECNNGDRIGVYIFNTVSLLWAKLPPASSSSTLEVPSARCCHTAALVGHVVYVWGGIVNIEMEEEDGRSATIQGEYCAALCAFDVATHTWSEPAGVSGTAPGERLGHSACVLGTVMYIYGGFNHLTGYTHDIHTLDTATMVWASRSAAAVGGGGGTPPPASLYHSATVVGSRIFVFGGLSGPDQRTHCDGVGVLDTESDRWLSLSAPDRLSQRPEGRRCHSAFAYGGELYVCGGITFERSFDDCWKLDPQTFSWRRVEAGAAAGCAAGTFTMCCCLVGGHTVLFEEDASDHLYVLDLDPGLKTLCKLAVIGHGLERSGLPHDVRWELAAMTATSNG